MMLKSKRTAVGIAVATALVIGYLIYALSSSAPAADDVKGWAMLILIFIAICVAAEIIAYIIVHTVFAASLAAKEKCRDEHIIKRMIESEMAEDERDDRITLMSSQAGYGFVGICFVLILIVLVFFDISAALLLNVFLIVFFISAVISGGVSIFLYERGDSGRICRRRNDI
jgi:MFS family permease